MTKSQQIRKHVIGKRIKKVYLNPIYNSAAGRLTYDPVIILENGVRIAFVVEETLDGAEYGINPLIIEKKGS